VAGARVGVRGEGRGRSRAASDDRERPRQVRDLPAERLCHSYTTERRQSAADGEAGLVYGVRGCDEGHLAAHSSRYAGVRLLGEMMRRWVGLIGSWALLVAGLGILGYAVAAEAITIADARKLNRVETIDRLIQHQITAQVEALQKQMSSASTQVSSLQSEVQSSEKAIGDIQDSNFVI